ncbi:hypothetical protein [Methylomonas koyamae]|uniref:hypothetical protein n=1 Tax=Methylomonas koyamae TaxID=702114 RepID=UPI000A4C3134|nr:hypothetical protein [Methylomonas koyamae]
MIKFTERGNQLLLIYQSDLYNDARWIDEKLQQDGDVTLRRTFTFSPADLVTQDIPSDEVDDGDRIFVIGVLEGGYYKISKDILGLKHDLLLDGEMKIAAGTFIAHRDISVFRKIDELIEEPIIVGGSNESAIPLADFELLLKTFPTSTELTHYARTRIASTQRLFRDDLGCRKPTEPAPESQEKTTYRIS